jgi:membrane-bound lytic murein transglycosylase D
MKTYKVIFSFPPLLFFIQLVSAQIDFCGEQFPLHSTIARSKLNYALKKNKNELTQIEGKLFLLDYFSVVLKKYNLPDDLKFIALVESRLNRFDKSQVGATGIWQFMPATALEFGLRNASTPQSDKRNSIIYSTHAACQYFLFLYNQLHNWALVCAAYNYGLGNIKKAIAKQGRDYFSMYFNKETSMYVYEVISFKMIHEKQVISN